MNLTILFIFSWLTLMIQRQDVPEQSPETYTITKGSISFKSDAPLELIEAESSQLKGLIDFSNGNFAFSVPMSSFQGFNSALQREHFNENYMESTKFPKATFAGKIIENVDPDKNGEVQVRAKGKLNIHGVEQERIIKSTLSIQDGRVQVMSTFTVLLQDHNIAIPKVVQQKIAQEIYVTIQATAIKK